VWHYAAVKLYEYLLRVWSRASPARSNKLQCLHPGRSIRSPENIPLFPIHRSARILGSNIRGDSSIRVFKIQKRVVRLLAGVSSRTSCRQVFKDLNISTMASLYILEVTCFTRKYCKCLEQNIQVHQHNMRSKLDFHVKMKKTEIYRKIVINMGTKVYNKLPGFLKK
jgi:hypothetical protein